MPKLTAPPPLRWGKAIPPLCKSLSCVVVLSPVQVPTCSHNHQVMDMCAWTIHRISTKRSEYFKATAMAFYRTLHHSHKSCTGPLILKQQFILGPLFEALNEWKAVNGVVDMTQCAKRCPNKFYWCVFKWALYGCSKFTCTIWLQQQQSLCVVFRPFGIASSVFACLIDFPLLLKSHQKMHLFSLAYSS